MSDKIILDACCGGKMCWFDKENPQAMFMDIRTAGKGHIPVRPNHDVHPDEIADFRDMPFGDQTFKLILFDPPHLMQRFGKTGFMHKKYGHLDRDTWREDITKGFSECWRVLEPYGVLVFKWSDSEVSLAEVLKCITEKPLFGHRTSQTAHWLCFMKGAKDER